jgi:hypothetical protein
MKLNSVELLTLQSTSGGYDILRLHSPSVGDLNEDFICGLCKSKRPLN